MLLAFLGLAASGTVGRALPAPVAAAASMASPTASPTPEDERPVVVYLLDEDDRLLPVRRTISVGADRRVGAATLRALLDGPTREESDAGLTSALDDRATLRDLRIDSVTKRATVDVGDRLVDPGAEVGDGSHATVAAGVAAGVADPVAPAVAAAVAQVTYTLTQFPSVDAVQVLVDGEPVDGSSVGAAGEPFALDEPQGRDAFEGITPLVLVESPVRGDEVGRTFAVTGTANTFEGAFSLRVVDADGVAVLDQAETASSGSGTRGGFETEVTLPASLDAGPFTLVAYELSARDGAEIVHAEIPLTLEPGRGA